VAKLRVAVIGCGFWSQFQIGAWTELPAAELVAVCDRSLEKALLRARQFSIPHYHDDAEKLLDEIDVDLLDIITDVNSHSPLVELASRRRCNVICQKPMAPDFTTAERMVVTCARNGVRFFVHENYRWQPQIRRLKQILDSGRIGRPFRARVAFNTAYPVFRNQPSLVELAQFAITDQGSHQFDICRYLFGAVDNLRCVTRQVTAGIRGEDVATTIMEMRGGIVVTSEISFASILEREAFPQTLIIVEGTDGSVEVTPGPELRITDSSGTVVEPVTLQRFAWQHHDYFIEPPSVVACNRNILDDLLGGERAETTAEDNLETVRLVFAAYESALSGETIRLPRGL
jgi:predicted dehydrogenase